MRKLLTLFLGLAVLMTTCVSGVVFAGEPVEYSNEEIVKEVAYAYFRQGGQIHYDQTLNRRHITASPEDATLQRNLYLDCTSFVNSCYFEAFGVDVLPSNHAEVSPVTQNWDTYAKENPENVDVIGYWENEKYTTKEEKEKICLEVSKMLKVGDVFTYRRVNPKTGGMNGHTMIYVGNDLFLHCAASDLKSYLGNTPEKTYERRFDEEVKGAIFEMPISEVFEENPSSRYLYYETETHKKTSFTLLRPLARDLKPTEETLNRMQIKGLMMEKTSSVMENSAVYTGDVIVYSIALSNSTNEDIKGVTVSDSVPKGTEFVSGSDGVEPSENNISWKGDIPAGKTVMVRYSVRVTEKAAGGLIISNETLVNGIKLGNIIHTVSGITKKESIELAETAVKYSETSNKFENTMEFVTVLYKDVLGIDLLGGMTATDVLNETTDYENHTKRTDTELSKLVVPNLYGGCDLTTTAKVITDKDMTRLVTEEQLSVGDIILGDIFPAGVWKGNFAGDKVYVYAGNSILLTVEDGVVKKHTIGLDVYGEDCDNILITLLAYNRFVVVRPSMKNRNISSDELYKDVKAGDWFYDAVKYAKDNGLIDAVSENEFAPDKVVTRETFIKALYRMEKSPEAETVIFEDVEKNSETAKAVSWAVNCGIVNGISETEFAPNDSITREQMAAMIYRYAKYKKADLTIDEKVDIKCFEDYDNISEYAKESLLYTCSKEIIKGMDGNKLAPHGTSTRAQVATVVMRVANIIK